MRARGQETRWFVALVAALALLVQASGAAHASGAMASGLALDAFGNPLCLSHEAGSLAAPGDDGKQAGFIDCCTLGCSPLSAAHPPPAGGEIGHVARREIADGRIRVRHAAPPVALRRDASRPRAPPLQA